MTATRPEEAVALLDALWEPVEGGWLELRPLFTPRPDRGSTRASLQARARRWLPIAEAKDRMPAVLAWCAQVDASAFFGVLPRAQPGGGGNADTAPGAVAWVDLDGWKTGEASQVALDRLRDLGPLAPSALVASGRGVHAYWLLSEPALPAVCGGLSARLALLVGGDATSDPARLLRLPGAPNPKHAGRPLARLVELAPSKRFHAEDLDGLLPALPEPAPAIAEGGPVVRWAELTVPSELPPEVRQALDRSARLRQLWAGEGRPEEVTVAGQTHRPDRSRSGYDASVVACLLGLGVADPAALLAAVRTRRQQDGRPPDTRQDRRAVEWVLQRAEPVTPSELRAVPKIDGPSTPAQLRMAFGADPQARLKAARQVGAPVRENPPRATNAPCPACPAARVSWFIDPADSIRGVRTARCWACGWRGGVFEVVAAASV